MAAAGVLNPAANMGDASLMQSEIEASRMPALRVQVGSWNLMSKYDEHIMVTLSYMQRKIHVDILHVGVLRRMEFDFEDVDEVVVAVPTGEPARLVVELARPPQFYKEQSQGSFVYTPDFTNGQASQSASVLMYFANGVLNKHLVQIRACGLPMRQDNSARGAEFGAAASGVLMAMGLAQRMAVSALRAPPTSSPRLDAITLQEQLDREMRDRQARYVGICPIRAEIYSKVFTELISAITSDTPKRGSVLRRIRDEAMMTIDGYKSVYESSIDFGIRKLSQAVVTKGDYEEQIANLESEIAELKKAVEEEANHCESMEYREAEAEKRYEQKDKEELELIRANEQLEELLKHLAPSKPDKDKK